jgi:hypothetical protein
MEERNCDWCGRPLDQDGKLCKACVEILFAFAQVGNKHAEQIAKDAAAGCELAKRVQGEAFMMLQKIILRVDAEVVDEQTDRTDAFLAAYKAWLSKEVQA